MNSPCTFWVVIKGGPENKRRDNNVSMVAMKDL